MLESVRKQLEKCKFANLKNFDKELNAFIIPKYTKPFYQTNKVYLVQIPKYLVNNSTSVIACNWNNSTSPSTEYLKIFINKFNGKMIYVDSIGVDIETKSDLNNYWSGWIPLDEIELIEEL